MQARLMPFKNRELHREQEREYSRRWRERHPEYRERLRQLPSYHPYSRPTDEAARASRRVYVAVKRGELVRPEACSKCGRFGPVEASHHDYSQPLVVTWLCRPCHRAIDAADPKGGTTKAPRQHRPKQTPEQRRAYRTAWARADRAKRKLAML